MILWAGRHPDVITVVCHSTAQYATEVPAYNDAIMSV